MGKLRIEKLVPFSRDSAKFLEPSRRNSANLDGVQFSNLHFHTVTPIEISILQF